MKIKVILVILFLALGGLMLLGQRSAAVAQVAYPSPTPGSDGRIIYMVQEGDTCEHISLLFNVPIEFIRTSNLLDQNCTLVAGHPLLIGIAAAPTATSPASSGVTSPTVTPTSTPVPGNVGTAKICVLVYDDVNGDGLRQEKEDAVAGAALSLTNPEVGFSQAKITLINSDPDAYQGMCFEGVPPGKYNISAASPEGYNPTTNLSNSFTIDADNICYVNFGIQRNIATSNIPHTKDPSPLMGIIGATLILGGIGLGVYKWRITSKT